MIQKSSLDLRPSYLSPFMVKDSFMLPVLQTRTMGSSLTVFFLTLHTNLSASPADSLSRASDGGTQLSFCCQAAPAPPRLPVLTFSTLLSFQYPVIFSAYEPYLSFLYSKAPFD